ncbi:MAG: TorF family putative porin [Gammaproteobacteria bacterium]
MMNTQAIKAISLSAAVAAALASGVAVAEVTGNAAITNNYIWRGVTQTKDQAAGQGGVDWGHSSGFYAGTWLSNVDFSGLGDGYEMDLYAGFGGEVGGFGYDLGVLTYQYPVTPNFNFTEVYLSGTFSVVTIGVNYTVDAASGNDAEKTVGASGAFDQGDTYVFGSLDFPTKAGDFSLYAASYMFDNSDKTYANGNTYGDIDYVHYGASWGKGDFTFAVDKNDIDDQNSVFGTGDSSADNVRFTVMWSKEFELM